MLFGEENIEYSLINKGISFLKEIVENHECSMLIEENKGDIVSSCESINEILFGFKMLNFQSKNNINAMEIEQLIGVWSYTLEQRQNHNSLDRRFLRIYDTFSHVNIDDIYYSVMSNFFNLPNEQKELYLSLRRRYTFLNNSIDIYNNDFSLIIEHIEMLAKNLDNFKWLYYRLADNRSKAILIGIIEYWFDFDISKLHRFSETIFKDYYDLDIIQCDENEVFVDLGAYTGDSIIDYIDTYGTYKKIYGYEITPSTFEELKKKTERYNNIYLRNKGVGLEHCFMKVNDDYNNAGNTLCMVGNKQIEVVSLDEDIDEKITLVKMDIEGAEKDAIKGMQNHIISEKPRLMISTYHIPSDIFDIPLLIDSIRDDYEFYMRFNGRGIWPCDYVFFAK